MVKIFKIAICVVVALLAVGCEMDHVSMDPGVVPSKPTVPLKKRPIVPSTKLPRPRVAEDAFTEDAFATIDAEAYEATEWDYYEEW